MRKVDKLLQSVTGRGITKNMADCYEFIINHYKEGDRIYQKTSVRTGMRGGGCSPVRTGLIRQIPR